MFEYRKYQQEMHVYQDNSKDKIFPIVNAVTKAWIKDRYIPALLVITFKL